MEKKKKIILIILAILLLIGITIGIICLIKNKDGKDDGGKPTPKAVDKITIEFDTDGGSKVESITFNKGDAVELPATEKEGYTFEGWYNGSELVDNEATSKLTAKTVFLKAKWEEIKKEDKVMKITFDSKGGSKVSAITIKCENDAATIKSLPKNPTKDGYTFRAWEDKHGKVILVDAKLTCDDITLYAAYDKKETPTTPDTPTTKEVKTFKVSFNTSEGSKINPITVECGKELKLPANPTKEGFNFVTWTDKNGTPIYDKALLSCDDITLYAQWEQVKKEYTCKSGYTLKDGHRCVKLADPIKYCKDGWKEVNGECVNPSSPNIKGTRTCPSKTISGWTGTGYYYEAGRGYCAYYEMPSYTGANELCKNAGGSIIPGGSYRCYKYTGYDYTITCASDEKHFDGQAIAPGSNPGCYQVSSISKKCPDGYTNMSTYGECAMIEEATLQ